MAPKTFKGNYRELDRFLEHYEYVCVQNKVIDPKHKCLGLIRFCSNRVADLIEGLDEFVAKDWNALAKKLRWVYDGEKKKARYHIGHIGEFAKAWRKEEIPSLEVFKQYHREYLQLAGTLKVAGRIDEKDFNQGFWEGLNQETRDRIERRMMDDDPSLDLSVPFPTAKVIEAAEHIFNRNRFDKHLRDGTAAPVWVDEKTSTRKSPRRRQKKDEEEDQDTDSETEDEEDIPLWQRSRATDKKPNAATTPTPNARSVAVKKTEEHDEITELITKMEGLTIDKPQYRTYFARLSLLAPKISELYAKPAMLNVRSYLSQETRFQADERMRRDPPPHQSLPPPDRRYERREPTCYGCGNQGHRMDQCAKLETLTDQGHIKRFMGKLRWADGSPIIREPDETWENAVIRRLQQRDIMSRGTEDRNGKKEVYFVEVEREDSDAETDDQEELGWQSSSVGHLQAFGADRPVKVNREVRNKAQTNVLPRTHRMKEFPSRGQLNHITGQAKPIAKDPHLNRRDNRTQLAAIPTPIDVTPRKFEGKTDDQFVPMDVESIPQGNPHNNGGKMQARSTHREGRNIGQVRAKKGKTQSEVVEGIMKVPLTISLQELACISPSVRRDLVGQLRAIRDDPTEDAGKEREREEVARKTLQAPKGQARVLRTTEIPEKNEMIVYWGSMPDPIPAIPRRIARGDLLKLDITLGNAKLTGVVDSGSMVNMISAKKLEESGLPSIPLKGRTVKVMGVNGNVSRCKTWIPGAEILVTSGKLITYGDIYVMDDAEFEGILGRPYCTLNGVNIEERPRGTYVSWISNGARYELNASRAHWPPTMIEQLEADLAVQEEDEETEETEEEDEEEGDDDDEDDDDEPMIALAVSAKSRDGTDRSYIPISNESREAPDFEEQQAMSLTAAQQEAIDQRARQRVEEWRKELADEADDEREQEDEREEEY